jgi:peroxiredoxin family protein
MIATDSYIKPPMDNAKASYIKTMGEVTRILFRTFWGFEKAMHKELIIKPKNTKTEYHAFQVKIPMKARITVNTTGTTMLLLPL